MPKKSVRNDNGVTMGGKWEGLREVTQVLTRFLQYQVAVLHYSILQLQTDFGGVLGPFAASV